MDLNAKQLKLTKKQIEKLNALHIYDSEDVLRYYPYRYEMMKQDDYSQWKIKDKVTFEAEVISSVRTFRFGVKKSVCSFDVMAFDRILHVSIFNRPWAKQLPLNKIITISGVYNGKDKVTAMSYQEKPMAEIDPITPVYSVKEGITQKDIRNIIRKVMSAVEIRDIVPGELMDRYRLLERKEALRCVHEPRSEEDVQKAYRTLKYEEFLIFFVSILLNRETQFVMMKQGKSFDTAKIQQLIDSLPYKMTEDQIKVLQDIFLDMTSDRCMYRLLQGDVGCGKTLVAAIAMYACVLSGQQAALLAPTEILASQHEANISSLLSSAGVRVRALYAGMNTKQQLEVLEEVREGTADILIGTHSLIQERVEFADLGLVIADEQQRFGVEQRKALRAKGEKADFLLMSATPIPRTLASTLYGDMDISTIETMPPGRKQVITKLIRENSFRSVLDDIYQLLERGRQLYVICAAVEKNEEFNARNVNDTAASLQKLFGQKYNVGLLHGRMSSEEKQQIMNDFESGRISVLVSTTVVEVGVNVVNATGMIIYDADRFGMSQIHQLRGRVQRGSEQGYCWLLTGSQDEKVLERLEILEKTTNGFEISYQDLRLRGPGDILGTKQSGLPDFILGNPVEDTRIIAQARKDAEQIIAYPQDYRELIARCRPASYMD
ncbi:MAG: ATP-dependent DNA helicase RecG [Erysipelotrichaceae bacterium]|nr:ATP-dependent DNA helicase RecG [Erysipelotrichaceae bacterium]